MHQHPWQNGMELLEDVLKNKNCISTGCEGIDTVLNGGLRKGQLTELAGPSSSGKTQVCLCTALHVADKEMGEVMFLDTGNSFSSKRIASMMEKEIRLERVMTRIFHQAVFDIFTMFTVLNDLCLNLRQEEERNRERKLCLLIIDSISSLITPILGGKNSNGWSMMVSIGFLLKKLAYEHNIAVLVTNHTVGGERGSSKPALGESWKCIPHVRLFLSNDRETYIRNVSVLKHTSVILGRSSTFMINDGWKI
ncbi:hypothetical protein ZOSMA_198G00150 [Zostera marina]|uniref:RecA family profile 1 domain-containing protein n=1 Tax=Zostera marina TaxID=29655 RepID=A0A0K9PQX4_ZOSMR|nr:hypothetical protein ZOSMA_198G00150 [Zostera marina]